MKKLLSLAAVCCMMTLVGCQSDDSSAVAPAAVSECGSSDCASSCESSCASECASECSEAAPGALSDDAGQCPYSSGAKSDCSASSCGAK